MKILLLEDDLTLSESLKEYLSIEGFSVDVVASANEAYDKTFDNSYEFYLFDINLPDESGFEVLKNLKESGDDTPTFYITALVDIDSIAKGFSVGVDDYIKKPFDPEELVIRIKSKLQQKTKQLIYKDIVYNPNTKELLKGSENIYLGEVGLSIFDMLIKNKNRIVSQYDLLDLLENQNLNALRVNLNKLKNRLDLDIKNIRAKGYILEEI